MARQLQTLHRITTARAALVLFTAIAFASLALQCIVAAPLADQVHSLRKVPADAAFYSASLRMKEQWDTFLGSKAYGKLMEIPIVQFAKMQIQFQWQQSDEPPVAKVREYLQSPAGQDGLAVLGEMFSDEIFAYSGAEIAESLKLFMELNSLRRTAPLQKGSEEKDKKEVIIDRVLETLDQHSDTFKVPTMVLGFRIKDQARAKRELDEVHSLLRNLLDDKVPDLAAHLQREQVAGHEFLTLRLDGAMIPWEKAREAADDLNDEQFEKLKGFIMKHKLTVALGVADEFVLLSIGESTDHLEKMGQGPVLAEQPAIKRLEQHSKERVASLQYASKALAQNLGSANQTIEDLAAAAEQGLEQAKVSEEHRKEIVADIRRLNLARYMPEPGEAAGIGFLTSRGYEAFKYSESKRPMMDSSKPLTILSHAGGNPMVLVASRSKQNIQDYEQCIAWLKQTAKHVEKIAEEKTEPDDWNKYQKYRSRIVALLERLDQANREHLYPALADGQGAFILDLSATSKQWFNKMPESPKPLPMLELAFAATVSDAERLRQGVKTYIEVAREAYELIKEINPREMPELKLPKANVAELPGGGKLYSHALPKNWHVDPQVAVNAGLTDKLVAVSTMPKTTERLLSETTPDFDTSLKLDRPAALVVHVQFSKLVDAARPWLDYAADVATGKLKLHKDEDGEDAEQRQAAEQKTMMLAMVFPQIHQFLDLASVLRSATSITYEDNGVWVTHSETHIQDLK